MHFRLSVLPWWGWLPCALVASTVAMGLLALSYDQQRRAKRVFAWLAFVAAVLAVLIGDAGLMALILFVKWDWTSA